jgi:hypothetical protein
VLVKLQVLLHQRVRIHTILLSRLSKQHKLQKKLPDQNVVHQSDVQLQQVIDRIRKLNTAAGAGTKKSRHINFVRSSRYALQS